MRAGIPLMALLLTAPGILLIAPTPASAQSFLDDVRVVSELVTTSLVQNGTFDVDVDPWMADPPGVSTFVWDSLDADGSSASGSGLLSNFDPVAEEHVWATQCLVGQGVPGVDYFIAGEIYIPSGQLTTGDSFLRLAWYEGTACFGADFLGSILTSRVASDTLDSWTFVETTGQAHANTVNLQVRLFAKKDQPGGNFDVHFDNIVVDRTLIFQDGFETGDTTLWSGILP